MGSGVEAVEDRQAEVPELEYVLMSDLLLQSLRKFHLPLSKRQLLIT